MKKVHLTPSLWLTLGLSGLILLLGLFPSVTEPLLQFDRGRVDNGEWWRLLSGQVVHYGIYHLAMNIAALLLCGYVLLRELSLRSYISLLVITALGVGLGIYTINRELDFYSGLSGVLHGLIVAGLLVGIRETPLFNGLALALVIGKLAQEQSTGFDASHALLPVPVAVDAHAYGAAAGLFVGIALLMLHRYNTAKNQPSATR
jgi:rhomboid family GlyGly-CTERM serine protease